MPPVISYGMTEQTIVIIWFQMQRTADFWESNDVYGFIQVCPSYRFSILR